MAGGGREQLRGNIVRVRFRGSKGDQGRKGMLMKMKVDGNKGSKAVELLQELY